MLIKIFFSLAVLGAEFPISKSLWQGQMKENLSNQFCREDAYYIYCLGLSKKECEKNLIAQFDNCFLKAKVPSDVKHIKESIYFGMKIGFCLGDGMEAKYKLQKSKDEKCETRHQF